MKRRYSRRSVLQGTVSAMALGGAALGTTVAGAQGDVRLTFLNQSRGQADALAVLAENYASETGVQVTIDSPGPADYMAKLQASSQSDNMPDVYSATGMTSMAPYYRAGLAMNLEPELDAGWNENFPTALLETVAWEEGNSMDVPPGVYHAFWEVSAYAILANPALFQAAGIDLADPPSTMTEFIDQLKAVKETGSQAIQIAAEFAPTLVRAHASNWLTDEEMGATFAGEASWKVDGWRNGLQLLADLRDADVIANGALPASTTSNPDVEKSFFNVQDLAACYDGSFGIGVQRATAPDFTDYISFSLPKAADGILEPRAVGGSGKAGSVNPNGEHAEESLKFLKWLTEPAQEQIFMEMVPLIPANPAAIDPEKLSPQLAGFAALVDNLQIVPNTLAQQVNEAMIKGAQSLVLNERSVDQVLDDLDAAQSSI